MIIFCDSVYTWDGLSFHTGAVQFVYGQKKTLCDHDGLQVAPVDVREELRWNMEPDGPAQGYPYNLKPYDTIIHKSAQAPHHIINVFVYSISPCFLAFDIFRSNIEYHHKLVFFRSTVLCLTAEQEIEFQGSSLGFCCIHRLIFTFVA